MQKTLTKENNFVSAVLYLHNDMEYAEAMLNAVYSQLSENFKKFEIICVDDASTDKTCEVIKHLTVNIQDTIVSIVHMGYFQGVEASMRAGVSYAIGDFVFEFDSAVLDFNPTLIMDVYRTSLRGFDMVSAAPTNNRRASSIWFYKLFNRYFPGGADLKTERFRIISRRLINRIMDVNSWIPYRKAAYIGSGLAYTALPYQVAQAYKTKHENEIESYRKGIAVDTLMLYTDIAYKFSIVMSLIMALLTLASLVYTVVVFIAGNPISGWTTTMLMLSGGLFGVFCILAMLVKYMALLVHLQNKRRGYVVSGTEKV